ncbi:UNVERIFIED_ORG: hypothetical protein ABID57_001324 [Arthrobacter sp. UYEF1]
MAAVTGTLRNFGLANINYLDPEIIFQANRPAVGATGQIFATEPVIVTPGSDSSWTANLQDTEALLTEDVYYTVTVQWRDPANNYVRADFPDWRLYVPAAGGVFGDLLSQPNNPHMVIVSPVDPGTNFSIKTMWLQTDPADPDTPTNPANTGDLYELRNA